MACATVKGFESSVTSQSVCESIEGTDVKLIHIADNLICRTVNYEEDKRYIVGLSAKI